jgi:isoquinoline 1-oxidoreductase subunit beta
VAGRYTVANTRLRWVYPRVGVPVQMYRALGYNHTTFTKEVFIDELARGAGHDALAYRLALLDRQPRQAAVLRRAAQEAGWGRPLPEGEALGLAVQEANNGTAIAQVVHLRRQDGRLQLLRVVCAVDCGLVVNPDAVRAQVDSGVAFGLNLILHGEVTLVDGEVRQSNFHDFPLVRMAQMPLRIDVHFVDGADVPSGIGEPVSVPVAAAFANALSRLTGRPVRRLPLRPDDLA